MDKRLQLSLRYCALTINLIKLVKFIQYKRKEYSSKHFNEINKSTLRKLSCYRYQYFGLGMEGWHGVSLKRMQNRNAEKPKIIFRTSLKFC